VSRRTLGGSLDLAALALLTGGQGRQYRPTDQPTLRAAAVGLRSRGLTDRDIAQALGLAETAVQQLLGERA
jgi:DNA-binding NarL/FixJ family response regulator